MKPKQKILYLITKSNYGGAQKYIFELSVAARNTRYEVAVACGGTGKAGAPSGKLVEKLSQENIPVHFINSFTRDMSLRSDIQTFFTVLRLLRKEKPDILHVTSSKAGGIGALAGRLTGIRRIIFTSHGLTVDEVWRPRFHRFLIYIGTWLTLKLAHHSIMLTTETYERASTMPFLRHRVSLIKNGIMPIKFLERSVARASLVPHPLPQHTIWIGGVGELHPNKNWAAAIIALNTLPKHLHLFIIGEGEERTSLEKLITHHHLTDRVHLLGYHSAAPYLPAFDILLLPSKKEGLPYVLLEAGLAGLPVIASDLPGIRDIIATGETGILVEPTPQLLATTIEMLVRDEGMGRRLGSSLKEKVTATFTITRMCTETFALYESSKLTD